MAGRLYSALLGAVGSGSGAAGAYGTALSLPASGTLTGAFVEVATQISKGLPGGAEPGC